MQNVFIFNYLKTCLIIDINYINHIFSLLFIHLFMLFVILKYALHIIFFKSYH